MAHIIDDLESVESVFRPLGLPVVMYELPSASYREVPVARKLNSRTYYFLLETDNVVEVLGRCQLRNVTFQGRGRTYNEARADLREEVAQYNAAVTAAYLDI